MSDEYARDRDPDHELTMVEQANRLEMDFGPDRGLLAAAKLVSATLLSWTRYRLTMKVGLLGEPDLYMSVLVDAAAHSYEVEGSFRKMFEFYAQRPDPRGLEPVERQLWFACHAVEAWIERQLQVDGLGMTLVWGE